MSIHPEVGYSVKGDYNEGMHTLKMPSALVLALVATLTTPLAAQQPNPDTAFRRSDPALLSATERPQLVEFFHPN